MKAHHDSRVSHSAKSGRAVDARHESAHAVVAVRLGLPLAHTTIRPVVVAGDQGPGGRRAYGTATVVSAGYTTLVEGVARTWQDTLPDPGARERLEALALQTAAGPAADREMGIPFRDVSHEGDLQGLVQLAGALGVGRSTAEPPVREWLSERIEVAAALLSFADDGAAWDRVRVALARKQYLSGEEVKALVRESDRKQGKQPWYCTADVARRFLEDLKRGATDA